MGTTSSPEYTLLFSSCTLGQPLQQPRPSRQKVADALVEALKENRTLTRLEVGYSGLGEEACLRLSEVLLGTASGIRFVLGRISPMGATVS